MVQKQISEPLTLEGAYNVRDLGVYTNRDGVKLRERQLLRGDGLHSLTERDRDYLIQEYGVKAVIDLRSSMETQRMPCVWEEDDLVECYHVPLLDHIQSEGFRGTMPESLAALYQELLTQNTGDFVSLFRRIGNHPEGCVIFNCTAGKDRTGVTAMLLLSLAGVEENVIIEDYAASEPYLKRLYTAEKEELNLDPLKLPSFLFRSDRVEMERTLQFLRQQYGTAEQYLKSAGLREEELQTVRKKLLPMG